MLALSSDMLLIIDPRENTTIPFSPELCTNSSISCEERIYSIRKEQQKRTEKKTLLTGLLQKSKMRKSEAIGVIFLN